MSVANMGGGGSVELDQRSGSIFSLIESHPSLSSALLSHSAITQGTQIKGWFSRDCVLTLVTEERGELGRK